MSLINDNGKHTFNEQIVLDKISLQDWNVVGLIKEPFSKDNLENSNNNHGNTIHKLNRIINVLLQEKSNQQLYEVSSAIFQSLRNFFALAKEIVVDESVVTKSVLENVFKLFKLVEQHPQSVKLCLQALVNLICTNDVFSTQIWTIFEQDLVNLYTFDEYNYLASALIYNILIRSKEKCFFDDLLTLILNKFKDDNIYAIFIIEFYIFENNLLRNYNGFTGNNLLTILGVLKNGQQCEKLSQTDCEILIDNFKRKSDSILKTVSAYVEKEDPLEIIFLADIIGKLSSCDNTVKIVQNDKSLLINCVFLLKSIQEVGRDSQNVFTPIHNLSEMKKTEETEETDEENPLFGFKGTVIRILGNMCWNNRINQDELRELDAIPLLLDCCKIDKKNPFIMQWAIVAIRHVCKDNLENQKIIGDMNKLVC